MFKSNEFKFVAISHAKHTSAQVWLILQLFDIKIKIHLGIGRRVVGIDAVFSNIVNVLTTSHPYTV